MAFRKKKGWDWNGKQNDWLNKIQVRMPDGYTIYVDYPDGTSIFIPYGNSIFYHTPTNKELIEYYSNPPIPYPTQNSSGDIVPIWFIPNAVPTPVTIPTPTPTPAPILVP